MEGEEMEAVRSTARLAEPGSFDFEARGITTEIPRAEVEDALRSDTPPELFLDVARPGEDELHTVLVSWDRSDLERLLDSSSGGTVTLAFDREELAGAIDPEVEAQGIREKALVLTVFAATAAGMAGHASAMPTREPGDAATVTATDSATAMVTDASGGYAATDVTASERGSDFVTDVSSAAPGSVIASDRGVAPTDQASGEAAAADYAAGQAAAAGDRGSDFVTDVSSAAPGSVIASDRGIAPATDTGQAPAADRGSDFVTDVSSGAPGSVIASDRGIAPVGDTSSGVQGTSISAGDEGGISMPEAAAGAAVAGGLALLIAGAGFAAAGQRRRHRPGTA
jgi:hypothetical protein